MPLLLCDLDGTLVERAPGFHRWALAAAERIGGGAELAEWLIEHDAGGATSPEIFLASMEERVGQTHTPPSVEEFWREIVGFMRAPASVLDALARFRSKGWRLAIVANGSAMQAEKVAAAALESAVDAVCVSDIEGYAKPDPTLLRIAAERAGGNLDDSCWLVGDSPSDIEAAHNAGVRSVWLGRGRAWPRDDLRPDLEADSFEAAAALILGDAGEHDY